MRVMFRSERTQAVVKRRHITALLVGTLAAALLAVPALASTTRASGAPAALWGRWAAFDTYTRAQFLAMCPTRSACSGAAGAQQLQVIVQGSPTTPSGIRILARPRSYVGNARSVSTSAANVANLAPA